MQDFENQLVIKQTGKIYKYIFKISQKQNRMICRTHIIN